LFGCEVEGGVVHAEGFEEVFTKVFRIGFAGDDFEYPRDGVDPGLAVAPFGSRLEIQRFSGNDFRELGEGGCGGGFFLRKILESAGVRKALGNARVWLRRSG
jgi:hypothetical protein